MMILKEINQTQTTGGRHIHIFDVKENTMLMEEKIINRQEVNHSNTN